MRGRVRAAYGTLRRGTRGKETGGNVGCTKREKPPSKGKVGTMLVSSMDATRSTDYLFAIGFSKRLLFDALCQRNLVVIAPVQVTSVVRPDTQRRGHDRKKEQNGEHEKTVKVQALPSLLTVLVDLVGIRSSSLHFSLLLSLHFNLALCRQDVSPSAAPSADVHITEEYSEACCSQQRAVHERPKAARKGGVARRTGALRDALLLGGSAVLRLFGLLSSLEHSRRLALLLLLPALHLPLTATTISRALHGHPA